jgi:hypothetical protein
VASWIASLAASRVSPSPTQASARAPLTSDTSGPTSLASSEPNLQYHLNNLIEEQLRNELFIFIYANHINGSTIDEAVAAYQLLMNFTEEQFSLDAIRRAYFRRKKEYENIFRTSVTQNQPNAPVIS